MMLPSTTANTPRAFWALALGSLTLLSYVLHQTEVKMTLLGKNKESSTKLSEETGRDCGHTFIEDRSSHAWCTAGEPQRRQAQEMGELLKKLDRRMPNVTFRDVKTTTSARSSKVTLLHPKASHCVGDTLLLRLDMYDHLGSRKGYGGDFLRARVSSAKLKAGASGHIEDYRNGTYLVNFTLFWEGDVRVSIVLIHPSEGVSALWAARKKGYERIAFTGTFLNGTSHVVTKCGFNLTTKEELCEYLDQRDQEAFYCVKPELVPCEAFTHLKSNNRPVSYLTALENHLFNRSNIGVEIPQPFGDIQVLSCNRTVAAPRKRCTVGMSSPTPSGFVWQNRWYPVLCTMSSRNTLEQMTACLARKLVYLLGDSTVRQWMEYLTKRASTLKLLDTHGFGKLQNLYAVDTDRNIQIQWEKHGHPLITVYDYSVKDHRYVPRGLDQVAGDRDTVVVVSLGQHFRPFPVELFLRRMLSIRAAIQRLLLRSPDTKVVIKAENIREMSADPERFGDIHGYAQDLALREIFQDLGVGFINAWDMSIAYGVNSVHPREEVIESQINVLLAYIC
ncbi:NXPE family member 4-like [Paroedura picta]|uniref:NXPE family member 4-like n=1 Tax=Paroedura picta TaxID=143630 RepID=UPI004056898A